MDGETPKARVIFGDWEPLRRLPITGIPADCIRWVLRVSSNDFARFVFVFSDRVETWVAGIDGATIAPLYLKASRQRVRP